MSVGRTLGVGLALLGFLAVAGFAADELQPVVKRKVERPAARGADAPVAKRSVPAVRVQSRVAGEACTAEQEQTIETARKAAELRSKNAVNRMRGVHPQTGERERLDAEQLAYALIDSDVDFAQVRELSEKIRDRVSDPSLATVCEAKTHPSCAVRSAFVEGSSAPIHICPHFFETSSAEQRIRTMVHESAHLIGIREPGDSETYCVTFDCESACGGFYVADAWAHYLHCQAGETPDQPDQLEADSDASDEG